MANFQLFHGLPDYDYRQALVDVLNDGAFQATGSGRTTATLATGDITLTVQGTGLNVADSHSIAGGTVTSLTLTIGGVQIGVLEALTSTVTGDDIQGFLDSPPGDVWSISGILSFEPLNITGSPDEDYLHGTNGNDTITGGGNRDYIFANDGNDEIFADDHNAVRAWGDLIQPGLGNNVVHASTVWDPEFDHQDGHDLSFTDLKVALTINTKTGLATATGMQTTFENVHWVLATGLADKITGGYALSYREGFTGMGGNDTINGKGGRDVISYNEEVEVGATNASGDYVRATHGVVVKLAEETAKDAFGFTDTLLNIEDIIGTKFKDKITGDDNANRFEGYAGSDALNGGGGKDELFGGLGKDTLNGGADNDRFVFDTAPSSSNIDKIIGFSHNHDEIVLDGDIFAGIGSKLSSSEFQVRSSGHTASKAAVRIIYNEKDGSLWWDEDGKGGDHSAKQFAILDGHPKLSVLDFDIV